MSREIKRISIDDLKSSDSKGFFVRPFNRALTVEDVEGSTGVFIEVFTGTQHPFFYDMPKSVLIDKLQESGKPKIVAWHYETDDFTESLNVPADDAPYHIVIGSSLIEHV